MLNGCWNIGTASVWHHGILEGELQNINFADSLSWYYSRILTYSTPRKLGPLPLAGFLDWFSWKTWCQSQEEVLTVHSYSDYFARMKLL